MIASAAAGAEVTERRTTFSGESDLLRHHRVLGVQILPGAAFVDLAYGIAADLPTEERVALDSLRLLRPLPVRPEQQIEVRTLAEHRSDSSYAVRVQSRPAGVEDVWQDHAVGRFVAATAPTAESLDLEALKARAVELIDSEELYQVYGLTGIDLGPLYQVVQQGWLLSKYESMAELRFPAEGRAALEDHVLHPALLDGAFQASYGVLRPRMLAEYPGDGSEPTWTMVPYRIANMVLNGGLPEHGFSHVRLVDQRETRDLMSITVVDPTGRVRLRLELLTVRFALRDVVAAPAGDVERSKPPVNTDGPVVARLEPPEEHAPARDLQDVLEDVNTPILVRRGRDGLMFVPDRPGSNDSEVGELFAWAPALPPSRLGNPEFGRTHGARYAYVVGEMANGIASVELVIAAARARLLSFFGSGGLEPGRVADAVHAIKRSVGRDEPYGFCLLHDVHDLLGSQAVVDLYLSQGIRCVNASAFVTLTPPIVHYRTAGIHQLPDGQIVVPNRVFAKVSREEVARRFFEPPPPQILEQLVRDGSVTEREAELARTIPMADDVTAEADSGGHTDRQPLVALLPALRALRDDIVSQRGYKRPIRVGAAGGLGTPESVAAAFTLGADYVLTGSINQACVEAGTSRLAREMLAGAGPSDVAMGADAGSFEMGSQVQVLRRGTLFAARSQHLLELYRRYGSLGQIPARERQQIETNYFRKSIEEVWDLTQAFFQRVDPRQLERAEGDERHRMALVLRWYLGLSSSWAQEGVDERRVDFQIWCGPAMGAFNAWVRGSFLEDIDRRGIVVVAENLMHGAAAVIRRQWLTAQGVTLPHSTLRYRPRPFPACTGAVAAN